MEKNFKKAYTVCPRKHQIYSYYQILMSSYKYASLLKKQYLNKSKQKQIVNDSIFI